MWSTHLEYLKYIHPAVLLEQCDWLYNCVCLGGGQGIKEYPFLPCSIPHPSFFFFFCGLHTYVNTYMHIDLFLGVRFIGGGVFLSASKLMAIFFEQWGYWLSCVNIKTHIRNVISTLKFLYLMFVCAVFAPWFQLLFFLSCCSVCATYSYPTGSWLHPS